MFGERFFAIWNDIEHSQTFQYGRELLRTYSSLCVGSGLATVTIFCIWLACRRAPKKSNDKRNNSRQVAKRDTRSPAAGQRSRSILSVRLFLVLALIFFVVCFVWEFNRMYQREVAKKAAIAISGRPVECTPEKFTNAQMARAWLRHWFSWTEDPCLRYYQAVLVDPLLEVNPLVVSVTLVTRSVLTVLEVGSHALAACSRALFARVPAQWQPPLALFSAFLTLLGLVMACGYSIVIPWVFQLTPHRRTTGCQKHRD